MTTATTLKLRALTQQILILTTTSKATMSRKSFTFSRHCCWKSSLLGCDTQMGECFLHLQCEAIQVLDCLALQMKEFQSFQMLGTTHPAKGCHILQDLNELFPNSSHITKQLTHHTTNSSVATVWSSCHTRLHTLQWYLLPISSALGPDKHESPESVFGAWPKDRLPQSWMPHSEFGCQ